MLTIREATMADAELLSKFMSQLDYESDYLLYHPGERDDAIQIVTQYLTRLTNNEKSMIYVAENQENNIVATICGESSAYQRIAHVMKVNIAALKAYRRTGIGRKLSYQLLAHAIKRGIHRVEVTVIKENKISLNLCQRMGFELEGIKKQSIKIGDRYHDEYLLARFI